MSNNKNSTNNPEGVFAPIIGLEFELTDSDVLRRHGIVSHIRHSFKADDYDVTYTQLSFNYRFKFIHSDSFSMFAQAKLIALTFYKLDDDNEEGLELISGSSLQTPMGLGFGMDVRLGKGFVTIAMNDIVAPGFDADEDIAIDITLGYKFRF